MSVSKEITILFSDSSRPNFKEDICDIVDLGSHQVQNVFYGKNSNELTNKDLISAGEFALGLLKDESYLYYLPAYLYNLIKIVDVVDNDILEYIVSEFTPLVNYKYTLKRLDLFTKEQISLICDILEECKADFLEQDFKAAIELLRERGGEKSC